MTEKELRKLSRTELLELMLKMSREMEKQKTELEELRTRLEEREIVLEQAGSIAEAAVKLNALFQTAQNTADEYLLNVEALAARKKEKLRAERRALKEERRLLEAEWAKLRDEPQENPEQENPEE